ncbi:MAG TPA: pyrroloquinoline quinone biosynthesis peptide chaperone PqqD [Thermoanaerobaculia bacterium]|nr:pyrroloquinoline quinone biosynthesis peptide chaperone PqqD [Thermoanaerobaculia bacterium]
MIGPESRPRRKDRVLVQRAEDQWILLNVESGQYYALDEVSGRVWDLCDGSHSVSAMVDTLSQEYDAPADAIQEDVLAFLGEMAEERLVIHEP